MSTLSTNTHPRFVQLSAEDCTYLLTLIQEMDSDTAYTTRQRGYTIPKLEKIAKDPSSARLAYQDVDYLLDLIEDDEDEGCEQQRLMTLQCILDIQALQQAKFEETRSIDTQREARRARRSPIQSLQEHFQGPQAA